MREPAARTHTVGRADARINGRIPVRAIGLETEPFHNRHQLRYALVAEMRDLMADLVRRDALNVPRR
jgi:hypothetical protein